MWWIAPIAGAALGAFMGKQQQDAAEAQRREQALINMYAPLFGQAPQATTARQDKVTPGIMQGAMSGYQMQQQAQTNDRIAQLYSRDTSNPTASTQTPLYIPYAQPQQSMQPGNPYAYGTNPNSFLGG